MKKIVSLCGFIFMVIVMLFSSCSEKSDNPPPVIPLPKVGLISGLGGFSDRGFNQLALSGLQRVATDVGVTYGSQESYTVADFTTNINYFASSSYLCKKWCILKG